MSKRIDKAVRTVPLKTLEEVLHAMNEEVLPVLYKTRKTVNEMLGDGNQEDREFADLNDATGETPTDDIATTGDATIDENFASLARKVNQLIAACRDAGILTEP
jgi:hypothetical protein